MKHGIAKSIEIDGIKFPSEWEGNFYQALKKLQIPFEYQYKVLLTPKTMMKDKKIPLLSSGAIREVSLTIDFVIDGPEGKVYIDTKGSKFSVAEDAHLKFKLFKFYLVANGELSSQVKFIFQKEGKILLKLAALNQKELFLKTLFSTANF